MQKSGLEPFRDGIYGFNQVCELVNLHDRIKLSGCKWVYKRKRNVERMVETYKARLIGKRYAQKKTINCKETFLPITILKSICILVYQFFVMYCYI